MDLIQTIILPVITAIVSGISVYFVVEKINKSKKPQINQNLSNFSGKWFGIHYTRKDQSGKLEISCHEYDLKFARSGKISGKAMRYIYISVVLIVIIILNSCNDDPLSGKYVADPYISFLKEYYKFNSSLNDSIPKMKIITQYSGEEEIFISVAEHQVEGIGQCPADGNELFVIIQSVKGEREIFSLSDSAPRHFRSAVTQRNYFKFLRPVITDKISPGNKFVEFHSVGDTLTAYYNSYWNSRQVSATITYNPIN